MRLSGRQIDCIRGGRSVFAGLDFEASSGQASGRGRPERLRQDLAVAPDRGPPGAGRRIGRPRRRRGRTDLAGTIPLSRPSRCAEAGAERRGKPVVLAGFSRRRGRRHQPMPQRRGARPCHASAGGLSLRRPAAAAFDRPPARGAPAGLASGRADLGARYRRAGPVRRRDARTSRRRRHHHCRHPCPARDRDARELRMGGAA